MKREYEHGVETDVTYFVGTEVEHTPAYGKRTLFVVGVQPSDAVEELYLKHNCEHIYFGANMSFNITDNTVEQWGPWEAMIRPLLDLGILVTLDVGVDQVEGLLETGFAERYNFIPMISVKLPYIQQLGYNACLKLDDRDMAATNPGVWVHRVHDLMSWDQYTSWDKYTSDNVAE
jgi:hypothetical protein